MPVEIVRIDANNAALLDNVGDVFDEPIEPNRVAAYVRKPDHIMLVAVSEGVVVGQCLSVIHRHPDKPTELYLDDLAVADSLKRRGVATKLIRQTIKIGKEHGCKEIWVLTEPDNVEANGLYKALGLICVPALMWEGEL